MLWKWRKGTGKALPSPDNAAGCNRNVSIAESSAKSAAKRAVSKFSGLVPKDPGVEAFISWMRRQNATGEWQQDELYEVYSDACQLAEFTAMGPIVFGRELGRSGCRRWDSDNRRGGKGPRLKMVAIPLAGEWAAKPLKLAAGNRLPKAPKSIGKLGRSPLTRKPVWRLCVA